MKSSIVCRNVKRLAKERKMSALELAAAIDKAGYKLDARTAARWIARTNEPSSGAVPYLCKVFGVAVTELYR